MKPEKKKNGTRPQKPRAVPGLAVRRAALYAIHAITKKGTYLSAALDHIPNDFDRRDKALIRHLVIVFLKRQGQLRALIRKCLDRPIAKSLKEAEDILVLGAAQLFFTDIPNHAVVSTSVELIARHKSPKIRALKGLANAVMRRLSGDEGQKWLIAQDAARRNTPKWVWDRWLTQYGEDRTRHIANCHLDMAPLDLTPKDDAAKERLLSHFPDAKALPNGTVRFMESRHVRDIPGYQEGEWWVQDAAALTTAKLVLGAIKNISSPQIADLCAAPGGKTMALISHGADVTAIDASPARLKTLNDNLNRTKLKAVVEQGDVATLQPKMLYDAVLLDAPCSSTGTMRRHPDVLMGKSPAVIDDLAHQQSALLDAATGWLKPGGVLVFATCSLEREEGEDQAKAFLKRHANWQGIAIDKTEVPGLEMALTKEGWLRVTPEIWAEQGGIDGFFIARFQKP